jgi:hypothetical protein
MLNDYSSKLPHLDLFERLDDRKQKDFGAYVRSNIKGIKSMKLHIWLQRTNQR